MTQHVPSPDPDPAGRVALITGGSSGIGAATATEFARLGYRVVINYHHRAQVADKLAHTITAAGGQAITVAADVRDPDHATQLATEAVRHYGRVDTLVCNAATPIHPAPFASMPWTDFAAKLTDELAAAFHICQAVLPIMQQQAYGRIVFVSSNHSEGPAAPGMIAHGTAKAALNTFARYLAHEQGPHQITANVVSPGYVHTDAATANISPQGEANIARRTPLGRVAEPLDIARIIALIGSEPAGFTTGATIPVNGGLTLAH